MSTPSYQGQGQPPADIGGGLFGRFGSFFGGSTPSYAGVGQPSSGSAGYVGGSGVAYVPAPAPTPAKPESSPSAADANAEVMTCPIDSEALASGHIAIVIPRERLGPCIDNP